MLFSIVKRCGGRKLRKGRSGRNWIVLVDQEGGIFFFSIHDSRAGLTYGEAMGRGPKRTRKHKPHAPPLRRTNQKITLYRFDGALRPRSTLPSNLPSPGSACLHHQHGPNPPFSPTSLMPTHPSYPTSSSSPLPSLSCSFRPSPCGPSHNGTLCDPESALPPHISGILHLLPSLSCHSTTSRCPFLLAIGSNSRRHPIALLITASSPSK